MAAIRQAVRRPPLLNASLWTAQGLIFVAFTLIGVMKLTMSVERLAGLWVWPGQVPEAFLRAMGLIDVTGGIGVLLPALTGIRPRLTVAAALGCTILQIVAITFHLSRGEAAVTPFNFVLLALSAFILWGRARRVPA